MGFRIGIDFDNTIIEYHRIFHRLALGRGWIPPDLPVSKEKVRAFLVEVDGNDLRWQKLQALAYGPEILGAEPFVGFTDFLSEASRLGCEVFVVSQKSEFSHFDPSVPLREWAIKWLELSGLLKSSDTPWGIQMQNLFFESTRPEKLTRIADLKCDLFIDDLLEVLEDSAFPKTSRGVWFSSSGHARSWSDLADFLKSTEKVGLDVAFSFIRHFRAVARDVNVLKREGNNRIFRLQERIPGGLDIAMKWASGEFSENRASHEFHSVTFLRSSGITSVPEGLYLDKELGISFYRFIKGNNFKPNEVKDQHVQEAVDFVLALDALGRDSLKSDSFQAWAKDSRPCLLDYLRMLTKRYDKILQGVDSELDESDRKFLLERVGSLLEQVSVRFQAQAQTLNIDLNVPLPKSERILSPSDFGFHNAILSDSGLVRFIDFEYFGWDDPAKLLADFFHSRSNPATLDQKWIFLESVFKKIPNAIALKKRWELVVDLVGFEWVLIVLNVFDPEVMRRRLFASTDSKASDILASRMNVARTLVDQIEARIGKNKFWTIQEP